MTDSLPLEIEQELVDTGARLSLLRRLKGLQQKELAQLSGVSVATIAALERGAPGVAVAKLARVLWALDHLDDMTTLGRLSKNEDILSRSLDDVPLRVDRPRGPGRHR